MVLLAADTEGPLVFLHLVPFQTKLDFYFYFFVVNLAFSLSSCFFPFI